MNLNNFGTATNVENLDRLGENPKKDLLTLENVFNEEMQIGKYKFKLKRLKGKALFKLVNTFGFANSSSIIKLKDNNGEVNVKDLTNKEYGKDYEIDTDTLNEIFDKFGDNFDLAMESLEFSMNGGKYSPLVVNGLYQVEEVETNIAIMYRLLFFVYKAIMLFMSISRQQLEDMQ